MNRRFSKYVLLSSTLGLIATISSLAQDAPCHTGAKRAGQPATLNPEPALTLASAERVYLSARLGATASGGSGRGFPSSDRALADLKKAIMDWRRFTIVNAPEQADLILTIVEGSRNSGIRVGILTERLLVARGGSQSVESPSLWESISQDGGIRNYRPVANTVNEFRAAVEESENKLPKELIVNRRAARNFVQDELDCLAHSSARLFLPDDREENSGAVKLSEAVLNVSPLDIGTRVSIDDFSNFSNYVMAMQKLLNRQFTPAERQAGWDLAVVGTLQPEGKAKVDLQSRPFVDQKELQIFYDNLLNLPSPAANAGPLEFRVVFSVWGGSEESKTER